MFLKELAACSPTVLLYGSVFGILTVLFQLSYTKALSVGSVSLTVMFVNFSMLIPVGFSLFCYGESLSALGAVGIALTLAAFLLGTDFRKKERTKKIWLPLTLLALCLNGMLAITQKLFAKTPESSESTAFVAVSYAVAAVVTLSLYLAAHRAHCEETERPRAAMLLYAGGTGIVLSLFQALNTYAVTVVPAAILFPSYSGGCILLSTVVGLLFFRDPLSKRQLLSLLIGTGAIVLMNL